MACGVGACLGCTIRTTEGNKRCCKDGPVFQGEILSFPQNPQVHAVRKDKDSKIIDIQSNKIEIQNAIDEQNMVKTPKSKTWETLHQDIDNFYYEEGYEYSIRIKISRWHLDKSTIGTILDYECLEILSKEQKDSDVPEYEYLW